MRLIGLGLGLTMVLAGCGTELRSVPMVSVSSSDVVMRGSLTPRMDFTGSFSLTADGSAVTCTGSTTAEGTGSMTCSDGKTFPIAIPKPPYGRFSGATVQTYPDQRVAVGWGSEADPAKLRAMLAR
jgi:hypothetical protein